jgi:hypothetical protein
MDRYDEVARKITGPIDESSGLDLDLARSVAAILREAFPGSAPPQEVGLNIQANGDFSQGSPPSPQAAKDARELASRIFDDCLKIEDGVNVPDEDCAAAEIERFVAARLVERAPRCGYDMGGECAVDKDGKAPSPSVEAAIFAIEKAEAKLDALCNGQRWRMSIPVRQDDPDIVIGQALMQAKAALLSTPMSTEETK